MMAEDREDEDLEREDEDTIEGADTATGAVDDEEDIDEEQREAETRARKLGWVPESEWRGKSGGWVSADVYLDRVFANRPIAEERFKKLEEQNNRLLEELERGNKRLDDQGKVIKDLHGRYKNADKVAYKRALAKLEEEMDKAAEEGDMDIYRKKRRALSDMQERARAAEEAAADEDDDDDEDSDKGKGDGQQKQRQTQVSPAVRSWMDENPWFNKDVRLTNYAMAVDAEIMADEPSLGTADRLAKVSEEVRTRFPEKFENERRRAPGPGNTKGSDRGHARPGKGRGWNDLPREYRDAANRMAKELQIPDGDVEAFRKDYLEGVDWDEIGARR